MSTSAPTPSTTAATPPLEPLSTPIAALKQKRSPREGMVSVETKRTRGITRVKPQDETDRDPSNCTTTITFCDRAENHAGMEQIGKVALSGFTGEDLREMKVNGTEERIDLSPLMSINGKAGPPAFLLIIRGGVDGLLGGGAADRLHAKVKQLKIDRKAKMKGKVVNKRARWNSTFGPTAKEADFANGKGTVHAFDSVEEMKAMLEKVRKLGSKGEGIVVAEINDYYNNKKSYMGFHGDSERKMVVGARLGASKSLHFQGYHQGRAISEVMTIVLNHGDMYVMCEKATGFDWKRKKIPTLRHAAGDLALIKKNARKPKKTTEGKRAFVF